MVFSVFLLSCGLNVHRRHKESPILSYDIVLFDWLRNGQNISVKVRN
jgi:hypothetical protein